MNRYSVKPWGDSYYESQRHHRGNFDGYPCAICGDALRFDGLCFECTRADKCQQCGSIYGGEWAC